MKFETNDDSLALEEQEAFNSITEEDSKDLSKTFDGGIYKQESLRIETDAVMELDMAQ